MKEDWAIAQQAARELVSALQRLAGLLDRRAYEAAVAALNVPQDGKVVTSGVGKSGHVARKIAATLTSLGVPAIYIHPTEAAHGDMALLAQRDSVLVFSRSGAAQEVKPLVFRAAQLGCPSVLITEVRDSMLGGLVGVELLIPKARELWGHAPTTSTLLQMALGDLLAVSLASRRGFTEADFRMTHPAGELGRG